MIKYMSVFFFFSSRRRHTRLTCDWSSDVCSSDLSAGGRPGTLPADERELRPARAAGATGQGQAAEEGAAGGAGARGNGAIRRDVTSPATDIDAFVAFLGKERNDSPHTVKAYAREVADFAAFCARFYGGPWSWAGVDRLAVRGFLGALRQRGLAPRSLARALSALRTFYRFLNVTRGVEVNPAKATRTPKFARTLPLHLDRGEVDFLFAEAERRAGAGGFKDTRDLAILELVYTTGVRLAELAGLNEQDVDLVSDQVKVRGKGRKER